MYLVFPTFTNKILWETLYYAMKTLKIVDILYDLDTIIIYIEHKHNHMFVHCWA